MSENIRLQSMKPIQRVLPFGESKSDIVYALSKRLFRSDKVTGFSLQLPALLLLMVERCLSSIRENFSSTVFLTRNR